MHHEREARLTWVGGEEGVCDCVTLQPEPLSKGTPVVPEAVTILKSGTDGVSPRAATDSIRVTDINSFPAKACSHRVKLLHPP